ncbi:hypothetical protein VTJ83DRAFT_2662 [Remersonia thermophila]|uniref:Uncharacterized protein n=1 Tax=Remersonia thermophila TaxID=72144 RepID=A0ABR4DJC0_9PEZI
MQCLREQHTRLSRYAAAMATAKRPSLRNSRRRRRQTSFPVAPSLALPTALLMAFASPANARCRAVHTLFFSTADSAGFSYLDDVTLTYRSDFAHPSLSCWCGTPGFTATEKLRIDNVSPFDGTATVTLNFISDDPCWFELYGSDDDNDIHCRGITGTFLVRPRPLGNDGNDGNISIADVEVAQPPTDELRRRDPPLSTATPSGTSAASDSIAPTLQPTLQPRNAAGSGSDSFNIGAKVALGVGIALICIAIGAMGSFLYFRRRRRGEDPELSGGGAAAANRDHNRRAWRKGPERKRAGGATSEAGNSDEPLCPIQPVFDGFPGSTGYDDVRSLHSASHTYSTYSHSPTAAHSPTYPAVAAVATTTTTAATTTTTTTTTAVATAGLSSAGFWTEGRSIESEELAAARLRTQMSQTPIVVSYGPNPVTPTVAPRLAVAQPPPSASPLTPATGASAAPFPGDYNFYSHANTSRGSGVDQPSHPSSTSPSPPRPAPAPIVVSYGPNKVTPTPAVVSPTVPPDEAIINRRFQEAAAAAGHAHSPYGNDRRFSWEQDSPLLGVASPATNMGPLPPYATTEDFEAMEKGAVRKLAEPQAEAELPPTKDGFYHYSTDIVEYELPGATPNHAPQLPFKPYKRLMEAQNGAGPSSSGSSSSSPGNGPGSARQPGGRSALEVDEQKFLLDDVEMRRLREEKARIRAAQQAAARAAEQQEEPAKGKA